jgi:hypothetical protein
MTDWLSLDHLLNDYRHLSRLPGRLLPFSVSAVPTSSSRDRLLTLKKV